MRRTLVIAKDEIKNYPTGKCPDRCPVCGAEAIARGGLFRSDGSEEHEYFHAKPRNGKRRPRKCTLKTVR